MPTRQSGAYAENTLAASAARTVSGDSGIWDGFGQAESLIIQLEATVRSGTTPTLDVVIEHSLDGVAWYTLATFAQLVAATVLPSRTLQTISVPFADRVRARWTIAGTTPSWSFSILVASQTPTT